MYGRKSLIANASLMINSGFYVKPKWFDPMLRAPPPSVRPGNHVVKFATPEDRLYLKLINKKPMLKYEVQFLSRGQTSIAQRFAYRQWKYMSENKMSEQESFDVCQEKYLPEIRAFVEKLNLQRLAAQAGRDRLDSDQFKGIRFTKIMNHLAVQQAITDSHDVDETKAQIKKLQETEAYFEKRKQQIEASDPAAAAAAAAAKEEAQPSVLSVDTLQKIRHQKKPSKVFKAEDEMEVGDGLRMMDRAIRLPYTNEEIFPPKPVPMPRFDSLLEHFEEQLQDEQSSFPIGLLHVEREFELVMHARKQEINDISYLKTGIRLDDDGHPMPYDPAAAQPEAAPEKEEAVTETEQVDFAALADKPAADGEKKDKKKKPKKKKEERRRLPRKALIEEDTEA